MLPTLFDGTSSPRLYVIWNLFKSNAGFTQPCFSQSCGFSINNPRTGVRKFFIQIRQHCGGEDVSTLWATVAKDAVVEQII